MREAAPRRSTVGAPPASTVMGHTPPGPIVALETPTLMNAHFPLSTRGQSSTHVPRTLAMDGVPTVFMPIHWKPTPTCPANQRTTGIAKQLLSTSRAMNLTKQILMG